MGNEHSRNNISHSNNVTDNIKRDKIAPPLNNFVVAVNMDEIPGKLELAADSKKLGITEIATTNTSAENGVKDASGKLIDKFKPIRELDNAISSDGTGANTEIDKITKVESIDVVKKADDEQDATAELVGIFFEADEKAPVTLPPPIITITRETPIPEESPLVTDKWSESTCLEDSEGKEAEEKEESDRNNSISYEDDVEGLIASINLDEGSGSQTVKHFSPREVHNGKVIGEGGFGRVLKGNLHGGTPVAIKLFHAPLVITSELDQLLTLKHQNLASVFGIVHQAEEPDCPQLVLCYFSEGSVLQYLSRHENPEDNSTLGKIGLDVIEGCQFLQSRGIVHGNLAARNILVEKIVGRHKTYYNAKISDIGIIRFAEASGGNYMKIPGGDRVVPVRWVPKEIIQEQENGSVGTDFTFASDVWSFGVVLWEIWTRGAIPYGASYSNLRVIQFLKDGYSPLKVHRPTECHPKVVSVMESIFQEDPARRPTFDYLQEHFKKYKGYGKEHNKPKVPLVGSGGVPRAGSRGLPPTSPTLSNDLDENCKESGQNSKQDEKSVLAKKKKNKKNKKLLLQGKLSGGGVDATSTPGSTTMLSGGQGNEVDGGGALSPESPRPRYQQPLQQREDGIDTKIAALLKRVNQLEKERRSEGRGGGHGGRGGGGIKATHWQKRQGGAPRFNRGGYHDGDYNREARGGTSVQVSASSPTSAPPPSSQAPPPYTEDPLPHHSSSRFSAPLPEYEYGHNPRPGGSRGAGGRGGYPGDSGSPRSRAVVLERANSSSGSEDFIRKIKRLAEEIEFLRAEKMTQELLKKSAELADIMKVVTSERSESANVVDPEYSSSNRGFRSMSPRQVTAGRGDQYYTDGYDDYDYNGGGSGGRWPRQNHRDFHQPPPHSRQGQHRGGSGQQRRPYFKGRGGTGGGHRGNFNNGRYNDDDGGGGGNYGPYGN